MRLWHPYPLDVVRKLYATGIERIVSVPIAPYSVHVYHASVAEAVAAAKVPIEIIAVPPWNLEPSLVRGLADEVERALASLPSSARTLLILSAHSLPEHVVRSGDPYPRLIEATAQAVVSALGRPMEHCVAYQSQGMRGENWLGPDLATTFRKAGEQGFSHLLMAPVGFLSDHIEILYDIDIEAQALAHAQGLSLSRTRTLNAAPVLIDALETVIRRALALA